MKHQMKIQIQGKEDRDNVVIALANNDYDVHVEVVKKYGNPQNVLYGVTDYFVCFEESEDPLIRA